MQPCKFALLSRNIVPDPLQYPGRLQPLNGVVLVSHGLIESEYVLEDLGDLCVSPGLVDLDVEFNGEAANRVTKAAVMGGVTTVVSHQHPEGSLYTDFAPLGLINDETLGTVRAQIEENGVFGLKTFLTSQDSGEGHLTYLREGLAEASAVDAPVFVHPEFASERLLALTSPCRALDTAQRQGQSPSQHLCDITAFEEASDEDAEDITDDIPKRVPRSVYHTPITKDPGVMRRTSLKVPTFVKPFDASQGEQSPVPRLVQRKRISLPNVFRDLNSKSRRFAALSKAELAKFKKTGVKESIKRGSWMSSSSAESTEEDPRKCGLEDFSDLSKELGEVKNDYTQHLVAHPSQLETDAVEIVLAAAADHPSVKVHFTVVSSADAVQTLLTAGKLSRQVTCATATPFLYYSDEEIKPGDTRYKCNPPIRDPGNRLRLWDSLKSKQIDCLTSYHQPHNPGAKLLGSFKKAKNGITSIGLMLQAVWTKLKPTSEEVQGQHLIQLAQWMSTRPAQIAGLDKLKGSLAPGKHADFIVWDPLATRRIETLPYQFPEMCPFIGEVLNGVIYRTYLRGNLVYSKDTCMAVGQVLIRKQFTNS